MNGFAILLLRFSHTVGFPVCDSAMYSTPNRTCRETFRSNSFPAAYSSRLRLASEMRSSMYTRSDGGRLSSSRTAFNARPGTRRLSCVPLRRWKSVAMATCRR